MLIVFEILLYLAVFLLGRMSIYKDAECIIELDYNQDDIPEEIHLYLDELPKTNYGIFHVIRRKNIPNSDELRKEESKDVRN